MRYVFLCSCAAVVAALIPTTCSAQAPAPVDASQVAFKVEQLGGSILPYQATRLRFSLRNIGEKRFGPLPAIAGTLDGVKQPSGDKYDGARLPVYLFERFEGRGTSTPTAAEHLSEIPFFLDPQKRTSLSVAFGIYSDSGGRPTLAFSSPGLYSLKCAYLVDPNKKETLFAYVDVKVLQPEGVDKEVYEMLDKDKALAYELNNPLLVPPADGISTKLKKLIKDYPDSSYSPYAHLALARCYLTGKDPALSGHRVPFPATVPPIGDKMWNLSSIRVPMAMAADELEKAYGKKENNGFAFRPQALAIHAYLGDRDQATCVFYLNRDHRDSLQWINQFAGLLISRSTRGVAFALEGLIQRDFPQPQHAKTEDIWRWFRTSD